MSRIVLNIGGRVFETTAETLHRADYFRAWMARWKREQNEEREDLFLDRDPHIFKHVLALLRNPNYPYPGKYDDELAFYGIDVTRSKAPMEKEEDKLIKKLDKINNNICELKELARQGPIATAMACSEAIGGSFSGYSPETRRRWNHL